jgi:putative phosphoribosyl transferase
MPARRQRVKERSQGNRLFADRKAAGRALAQALARLREVPDVVVLALPRGGVPVAFEVADFLGAPLDVYVVRKLGVPGQPEFAMGAIASGGGRVVNEEIVDALGIDPATIDAVTKQESREILRREQVYRGNRPPINVTGKIVIVVDDGMATGSTMLAGVRALRQLNPARIILAVPHAPPDTCVTLSREVDELVCLAMPEPYIAVGRWYGQFPQLEDAEVTELLECAWDAHQRRATAAES